MTINYDAVTNGRDAYLANLRKLVRKRGQGSLGGCGRGPHGWRGVVEEPSHCSWISLKRRTRAYFSTSLPLLRAYKLGFHASIKAYGDSWCYCRHMGDSDWCAGADMPCSPLYAQGPSWPKCAGGRAWHLRPSADFVCRPTA